MVSGHQLTDLIGARPHRKTRFPLSVAVAIAPVSAEGAGARPGRPAQASRARPSGTASSDAFPSPNTSQARVHRGPGCAGRGGCQTDTNWNSTTVTALGIGFQAWDSCIGIYQSYYVFNTPAISTTWDIFHMELNLTEIQGSWNACAGEPEHQEPVYLHSWA